MVDSVSPVFSWLLMVCHRHSTSGFFSSLFSFPSPRVIFQLMGKGYESSGQQRGQGFVLDDVPWAYAAALWPVASLLATSAKMAGAKVW